MVAGNLKCDTQHCRLYLLRHLKKQRRDEHQFLTPVILATDKLDMGEHILAWAVVSHGHLSRQKHCKAYSKTLRPSSRSRESADAAGLRGE